MAREEAARRGLANMEFVNPGLDDRGMPEQAFQVGQEQAGIERRACPLPVLRCLVGCDKPAAMGSLPRHCSTPQRSNHLYLSLPPTQLQLVMTHDAIHDMAHPQQVASAAWWPWLPPEALHGFACDGPLAEWCGQAPRVGMHTTLPTCQAAPRHQNGASTCAPTPASTAGARVDLQGGGARRHLHCWGHVRT